MYQKKAWDLDHEEHYLHLLKPLVNPRPLFVFRDLFSVLVFCSCFHSSSLLSCLFIFANDLFSGKCCRPISQLKCFDAIHLLR